MPAGGDGSVPAPLIYYLCSAHREGDSSRGGKLAARSRALEAAGAWCERSFEGAGRERKKAAVGNEED